MICDTSPLEGALRRLEIALETPVIPGEMADWCMEAVKACREVGGEFDVTVEGRHKGLLQEMMNYDPEQAPRIQQLKETDEELRERTNKFEHRLCKLCNATELAGADEVRVLDQVEETIKIGLELVIDFRKQELAISTWHGEALKRDRGVAD